MPLTFEDLDATEKLPASSGGTLTAADLDATEGNSALRSSLAASLPVDPNKAAEAKQLQGITGIPAPAIERNPAPVRQRADMSAIEEATRGSPALARSMSDPSFARLAHDDTENLAAVEQLFRTRGFAEASAMLRAQRDARANVRLLQALTQSESSLAPTPGTVARGLAQTLPQTTRDITLALKQGRADLFGDAVDQDQVAYERRKADAEKMLTTPDFQTDLARGVYSGGQSLVQQAPALALSVLTGSAVPSLAAAGATTGAEAYGRYRARGGAPGQAVLGASGEAAVEVATELLPMRFMVDKLGKAGAGEFLAGLLARELPGEEVATVVQDALDTAIANPTKTWAQYLAERPEAAYQTALATLVQSGAIGAVHSAANALAPREQAAQAAEVGTQAVQQLTELAKASELAKRDPESFQQFVDQAAEDGPVSDVYVDGKTFAQSLEQAGVPLEQVQAALPEAAAQLAEAAGTGGLVRIPVGEFAAKIAPTELGAALLPHLKVDPNGMSQAEAQTFMQGAAEELRTAAEKQIAEQPAVDQFAESARAVETDLLGQLRGTGRFTEDVSKTYAALTSSFYGTLAQRLGTTPEALYEKYPLRVQAELPVEGSDVADLLGYDQAEGGQRGRITLGADVSATPSIVSLLKRADLSTFTHELGHFQLEVLSHLAGQDKAIEQVRGDMQTLLNWFGVKDLETWRGMTTEQRREHHEQFARGFEAYLFEGKAPSDALRGLFARVRSWMIAVYRSLRSLNVDLTPEVRQVMDRLVATDEQIAETQQVDAYAPLFKNAADAGMDPQQWANYQALGAEATEKAQEALTARGLRDLRWLRNARSRELKKLQRGVQGKRLAVRDEVATEVYGRRTYRAWQFIRHGAVEVPEDSPHKLDAGALEALYGETKPEKESKGKTADEFAEEARLRFLRAIKRSGGIDVAEAPDISGDSAQRAVRMAPGLFRKDGRGLDVIAQDLTGGDNAYISTREAEDVDGGVQALRDLVRTAIDGSPVFTAHEAAQHADMVANEAAEGARDKEAEAERAAIKAAAAPAWRKLGFGSGGMLARKEGVQPELVAQMFGYRSADEMVRDLLDAQPPHEVIEGLTDQRMIERYGDLTTSAGLERAADEAVHNEARSRMIATEVNALQKATGKPAVITRAAKQLAEQMIARRRIRDVRPAQHTAAEAKAAREAERSADLTTKAASKRDQLVQHYASKASHEALDEVEKGLKYLRRFGEKGTRENLDSDYLDQIDTLLESVELRRGVPAAEFAKRKALAKFVEEQRDAGLEPVIDDKLIATSARQRPYHDMTLEEFRGLVDAVRSIDHLGRLKNRLVAAREKREFQAVEESIAKAVTDNAKGTVAERRSSDRAIVPAIAAKWRWASALHRKFASLVRQMDGFQEGGPGWEHLVRTMNERGDYEASQTEKSNVELLRILRPVLEGGRLDAKTIHAGGKTFSRREAVSLLLNMGNAVNLERILKGEGLTPEALQSVVGALSREDAEAANKIWEYLDSFRPAIAAKEKNLTGVEPGWVKAEPFDLKLADGSTVKMRGGYYPIAYDVLRSSRSEADVEAQVQRQLERGLYARAQTARGHLKARTESTGRPLDYDFAGVLSRHVSQVIHDLAWHEYLVDANRLLKPGGRIDKAVTHHYGREVAHELRTTLRDVAVGRLAAERGTSWLNHLRYGTTISGLAWNISNTLINLTGITQSMVRIGPKWLGRGMAHWVGDARRLESSVKKIYEKSEMMRLRGKTQNRELAEIRSRIDAADSTLKRAYGKLYPALFYLQNRTQLLVDVPTWWGAYEKAYATEGMTEDKAVALADQAVLDAQGGGQTKDLAGVQRGSEALKLFTSFYSFFNTTFNLTAERYAQTDFKKPAEAAIFAADMLLLYTVPALLGTLVKAMLTGDLDDEDKLAKKMAADQISFMLGTMVAVREATAAVQAAVGVDPGFGYTGPASVRFFSDLYNLGKQVKQREPDAAFWKALDNVLGVLFHYPAGQINRTVEGASALLEGQTENPGALLAGPPK